MTFDRVKEILRKNKATANLGISYSKDDNDEIVDIEFDSPTAIEYILNLIDRDTEKDPLIGPFDSMDDRDPFCECPNCHAIFPDTRACNAGSYYKEQADWDYNWVPFYCPICGQAIHDEDRDNDDWSDESE